MAEGHRAVMRVILLDQHMAVEPAHFRNGEYADGAEGTGRYGKHFALGDVCPQLRVGSALQAVERDVARCDIAFQGALGHFFRQGPCHDSLELHLAERQLVGRGVAAVEAHKGIFQRIAAVFSLDLCLIKVCGHGVVDIQQSHRILADHGADVFAQRAVNIHFAGYRDPALGQAAVHVAGHESELGLECGPALVRQRHILPASFVGFDPIQQGDLILCQLV